jgi:hypothetical protein
MLAQREDVVTLGTQHTADPSRGQIGVQHQVHGAYRLDASIWTNG